MNIPDAELLALLAYRVGAIEIGGIALRHHMSWGEVPSMEVLFNGKLVIDGQATGFTNAAIESAIMHCRAILEFLGIQADKSSPCPKIRQISQRANSDDYGVEQFYNLTKLTREEALAVYSGDSTEAEAALALIFHLANKGLAHTSNRFKQHSVEAHLLQISFRYVPNLITNCWYIRLGINPPDSIVSARSR